MRVDTDHDRRCVVFITAITQAGRVVGDALLRYLVDHFGELDTPAAAAVPADVAPVPAPVAPVARKRARDKAFDRDRRRQIVLEYRKAVQRGDVVTQQAWAGRHGITDRTLRRYLDEFSDTDRTDT